MQPEKCLLCKEVCYLGHVITQEGVKPDPKKGGSCSKISSTQKCEKYQEISRTCWILSQIHSRFFHDRKAIILSVKKERFIQVD